ncbi:MAG: LPS biosynthesis protein WbpP [Planctomycetota bacterium]|nr:MAG: LPS biosynthesis protein WbpP [Planctomycetota bacterium]
MGRYLVTGGAGFVGSHIAEHGLALGHEIVVLDNLFFGKLDNLEAIGLGSNKNLDFVEGDIRDEKLVQELVKDCDGIFHEAALPSVPRSVEDPVTSHDVNINGSLVVLLAAREHGKKLVYAGSSSAYGDTETLPKHEGMLAAPLSPYAVQKLNVEHYAQAFGRVYGLPTVILRYFNVFGPRQRADSPYSGVIAKFCKLALDSAVCRVEGDGLQSRDFTYVADVARGNWLAMSKDLPSGTRMNLAGGGRYSLLDLLDALGKILCREIPREHGPARSGDVRHSQASTELAERFLGFRTEIDFGEGLKRTLDWYRETQAASE